MRVLAISFWLGSVVSTRSFLPCAGAEQASPVGVKKQDVATEDGRALSAREGRRLRARRLRLREASARACAAKFVPTGVQRKTHTVGYKENILLCFLGELRLS